MMKGKAFFMVRAEISNPADREAFDRWYETEHLPDAVRSFGAEAGWRGWSQTDPNVHIAFYQLADASRLKAIQGSDHLKRLIADFDKAWGSKVGRSREMIEIVQSMQG